MIFFSPAGVFDGECMVKLDSIDRRILDVLALEGRITVTELATRVALSKTPCQIRMKRMEDEGYIKGYSAIVDAEKLGEGHVAFVQVTMSDTKSAALEAFNQAALQIREIEQCHMIASSFDYLLKVRTRDMATYREILGEKISALPFVAQTSTFVVMEAVKDHNQG